MLLDDFNNVNTTSSYSTTVRYWEIKRKTYNIILLITSLILFIPSFLRFGISTVDFVFIIMIGVGANLCYTFGCSIILLGVYYSDDNFRVMYWSKVLLILGTIFSLAFILFLRIMPGFAMILD